LNNGSARGYFEVFQPSIKNQIIHGRKQSVSLFNDNTNVNYPAVTVNITNMAVGSECTTGSPEILFIWFYGDPTNSTEQMYVKVNDSKVVSDADLTQAQWQELTFDLASFNTNMSNVVTLSIGFERNEAADGSGIVFLDDILLYRPKPETN